MRRMKEEKIKKYCVESLLLLLLVACAHRYLNFENEISF